MRLGCDPEVFLKKKNKLISSIGRIGGNKQFPFQVPDLPPGFTLQEDNVSLEFGIPPASTKEEFRESIFKIMKAGKQLTHLSYSPHSSAEFPPDQLEDPRSEIFGCEPDFNAWTRDVNPPIERFKPTLRSAGGHVHVETNLHKENVIRAMDLYLGVPAMLMDVEGDKRRLLYGKAGAFRPKPYGVEYRTLSNFWIFNPKHIDWIWDETERALDEVAEHGDDIISNLYSKEIVNCINNNDYHLATQLCERFDLHVA